MIEDCRPSRFSFPPLVMGKIELSALRKKKPPPPRCCLPASSTSKAEGKRSRGKRLPLYLRRTKKANTSNSMIESLPDELMIEILLRLSADDIYDNARLVCRRWCHLIHTNAFVYEHLHRSSSVLLLKPINENSLILMTATAQGRVEISELSCRVNFPVVCSCNGLALCLRGGAYRGGGMTPFVFNPSTKSAFYLPRFPKCLDVELFYRSGMAYAAASMAYKVIGSYHDSGGVAQCGILTVGVDKTWRRVALVGLSPEARTLIMDLRAPLTTGCYLHWVSMTHVLSLNVETEIFTETSTPNPALMVSQGRKDGYYPLSTGRCLSLLISCADSSWEVWEMKLETWEWRKVRPSINLEAHRCKYKIQHGCCPCLKPVGWVRYPEVLAFLDSIGGSCIIIYNLDTNEIDSFKLSTVSNYCTVVQHKNSLVWLEKC